MFQIKETKPVYMNFSLKGDINTYLCAIIAKVIPAAFAQSFVSLL
jgi:hypothetical protein